MNDASGHGGAPGIATETRNSGTGERSAGSTTVMEIGAVGLGVGVGAGGGTGPVGLVVGMEVGEGLALAELGATDGRPGAGRSAATPTAGGRRPPEPTEAATGPGAEAGAVATGPGVPPAMAGRGWPAPTGDTH